MGQEAVSLSLLVANHVVSGGANLLIQSTFLIGVGLLIAWLCRARAE